MSAASSERNSTATSAHVLDCSKKNEFTVVNRYNLFFLGINIVIGSAIDIDFRAGYWMLLFNTILTGIGYILLTSSLAEMTSALPFSGGIYGIVRAFIHPFAGFYVACFELLINVFYIALSVRSFALLPIHAGYFPEHLFLVYCLVIYIVILSICLLGGKIFWWSNLLIGITCLVMILIYILGAGSHADFSKWKHSDRDFSFGLVMKYLPDPSLTYLGIQYLPLASKFVKEARKDVPHAMMETVAVVFPLIIAVITVMSSISPGFDEIVAEDHPLIFGFSQIFGTSLYPSHFFGLPGLLSTCFSFMYCFGRQASTMAGSGLLPPSFLWTLPGFGTPYVPLIAVTILSFILNIFAHHFNSVVAEVYLYICCMSTYIVVIAFFISYLRFIDHYSTLQRYYRSPFGKIGAIIGIGIFTLCMISVLGFQDTGYVSIVVLVGLSICIILIFRLILKGTHEFSEEEKNELFKAYLITANQTSKQRRKKKVHERSKTQSSLRVRTMSQSNPSQSNHSTQSKDLGVSQGAITSVAEEPIYSPEDGQSENELENQIEIFSRPKEETVIENTFLSKALRFPSVSQLLQSVFSSTKVQPAELDEIVSEPPSTVVKDSIRRSDRRHPLTTTPTPIENNHNINNANENDHLCQHHHENNSSGNQQPHNLSPPPPVYDENQIV